MSETTRERGSRMMKDVCGIDIPVSGRFVEMTVDHLFGSVWGNDDLSVRDRRLIVLGVLGALGDSGNLTLHMQQALQRGDLTAAELQETAVQITHYAGWPRGTVAVQAAGAAIAAAGPGEKSE